MVPQSILFAERLVMPHAATDSIERSERPALSALAQSPCSPDFVSGCGRVALYHGDCLNILPHLQGVDAVISDPPYGMNWNPETTRFSGGTNPSQRSAGRNDRRKVIMNAETANRIHPTQKPVPLMAWCMDKAKVPQGATVLDPYMGSGSTIIAAIRTGRKAIGIEKDPEHFKNAVQRIKRELAQGDLFLANVPRQVSLAGGEK